ncbi:four helix bundle protein [Nonlabens arenilitoris]|uniref:Four helix bundle protein n=2 Tax=Nonlabens arenilitoris TaxID=1217969 RepID=A0A2S7UBW4_9FLAO|nr:four helix bundle protein [Nonlabens arenilitoris]PQJ32110.1 four helix bundle protein [Nonlabens arenilitoris]
MGKPYDLEDRLISFAADVIVVFDKPAKTYASKYYAEQLIRSSGSVSLNFSEFAGAGTEKDKINKLRISLKEIKECNNNLKIQLKAGLSNKDQLTKLQDEAEQIIRILVAIINKR